MIRGGIAFFDSGVGGLSVLRACEESLCGLPIYYYGDNARAPYGNRNINDIRAYAHEAFQVFEKLGAAAAVVACNTVTALLIEELRLRYSFPIIGIEPALLPAVKKHRRVLVLATNATVKSERFRALCNRAALQYMGVEIRFFGCAQLAQAIEQIANGEQPEIEKMLPRVETDAVVLGCTHYSLIKDRIEKFYGAEAFDGNQGVADRLTFVLSLGRILAKKRERVTAKIEIFKKLSIVSFYSGKGRENKCFKRSKKSRLRGRIKNAQRLYFIGSGRVLNRYFYERMFVFGCSGGKSG